MSDLKVINNTKLVCPFRIKDTLIPNQFNAADKIEEFPECHYASCPFYVNEPVENTKKCLRAMSLVYE